jgi:ribose transport system ATP-binding protein
VLVGENGSGKSTVIKVLSGFHHPDAGARVEIAGEALEFGSATASHRAGARFVHQDLGLLDTRSVLDNLALGSTYPTRFGTIRRGAAAAEARKLLARVSMDVDPWRPVGRLSAAERTGVAVARALRDDPAHQARLLVLDEPTATLPANEVDRLLEIVRAAAAAGTAVLFVTHHLDEVFRLADRVTVLRDGRIVGTSVISEIDRPTLVHQLVGEEFEEVLENRHAEPVTAPPRLRVRHLVADAVADVSFDVRPGEILGIAGLTGSGRDTLLGAVFGARPRTGEVALDDRTIRAGRPQESIAAGIAYLSADRRGRGGLMTMSARDNLTIANLRPFSSVVRLSGKGENEEARSWFSRLDVRPRGQIKPFLGTFSGGNQQKVLLAKWMRLRPAVFLLDEPTQGVDIGAKAEVHSQLLALAAEGTAVVVASTDVEELPSLCSRVLVLRGGRITDELDRDEITVSHIKEKIMSEVASPAGQGGGDA